MSGRNIVLHHFYCLNCGNESISLPRKKGFQHSKFHRKKMYCIFCKEEINHIECKNYEEVIEFKENFEKGVYINEAEESISWINRGVL